MPRPYSTDLRERAVERLKAERRGGRCQRSSRWPGVRDRECGAETQRRKCFAIGNVGPGHLKRQGGLDFVSWSATSMRAKALFTAISEMPPAGNRSAPCS